MDRRFLLASLAAAGLGNLFPVRSRASTGFPFDLTKPEDNVTLWAKIVGSLDARMTYLQYYGEIFDVAPGREQQLLFQLKGLVKSQWTPAGPNQFEQLNFDHGLFCDAKTGEVLDTYDNPLTGKTNRPLHYKSGPFGNQVKPVKDDGEPFVLPWRIVGDQISVTQSAFGQRDSYLSPEEWGLASTGSPMFMNTSSTYIADVDEVVDPANMSVPADHIWTFLAPYPAWMLMGDQPGYVLWRWVGRKITDPQELDPYIVSEIEKRLPGYMENARPWDGYYNGWIQYTKERSPDVQ